MALTPQEQQVLAELEASLRADGVADVFEELDVPAWRPRAGLAVATGLLGFVGMMVAVVAAVPLVGVVAFAVMVAGAYGTLRAFSSPTASGKKMRPWLSGAEQRFQERARNYRPDDPR